MNNIQHLIYVYKHLVALTDSLDSSFETGKSVFLDILKDKILECISVRSFIDKLGED